MISVKRSNNNLVVVVLLLGILGTFYSSCVEVNAVEVITPPPPFSVITQFYDPQFVFTLGGAFGSGVPGSMWYDEAYMGWKNEFSIQVSHFTISFLQIIFSLPISLFALFDGKKKNGRTRRSPFPF
jgi:hypothetical protein